MPFNQRSSLESRQSAKVTEMLTERDTNCRLVSLTNQQQNEQQQSQCGKISSTRFSRFVKSRDQKSPTRRIWSPQSNLSVRKNSLRKNSVTN